MQRKEWIGICIVIVLLLGIVGAGRYNQRGGYSVEIIEDGKRYGLFELTEDEIIELEIGNVVKIQDGAVYMESATCKNQLCVNQGSVSHVGESIVCLPHKVVVQIHGE